MTRTKNPESATEQKKSCTMNRFEERDSVILNNNGQKIFGVIHKPLIHKPPYPVVLMCHGLGGHKSGKYRLYVHLSQALSQKGIASFRFDFRGSGDSEGDFQDMTIETEVSDALIALDYLRKDKDLDSSRIGIFGRSFGGIVSLRAAYRHGNIKSMALWAPIFNGDQWREKWHIVQTHDLSPEHREEMMRVNGLVPGRHFFEQLFALKLDNEIDALSHLPLLHVHGEKDTIVNLSHAERYHEFRRHAQAESKFILLPHSDHDFSFVPEQRQVLEETVKWFDKTLNH